MGNVNESIQNCTTGAEVEPDELCAEPALLWLM